MMRAVNMTRVQAFTPVKIKRSFPMRATRVAAKADHAPGRESSKVVESLIDSRLPAALLGLSPLLLAQYAVAKGGEYGLLEGRSVALLHPVLMGGLLAATIYAGWTGLKWRRTRTIGQDIKQAKAALPAKGEDGQFVIAPAPGLEARIAELETERKDLSKSNFRDKHYNMGALLLGGGVTIAVAGCVNTYMRTERLFPGPHLFAGAGIVALWAIAASLVPAMQKGNETARSLHIGLNTVNLALFLWQVPTGLEIVGKVFQFTSWP